MNIVVAIDSLKGSLTSLEAGVAIKQGIEKVYPNAGVTIRPLADGGEGTCEAVYRSLGGELVETEVEGPLGSLCQARYLFVDDEGTTGPFAVIELAQADGITQSSCTYDAALDASTFGVGQLIVHALDRGATSLYIGLGGSASTDGGAGLLMALGARLLDEAGGQIGRGLRGLENLASIDLSPALERLRNVSVSILNDVTNPLVGARGAARIFATNEGLNYDDSRRSVSDRPLAMNDKGVRIYHIDNRKFVVDVKSKKDDGTYTSKEYKTGDTINSQHKIILPMSNDRESSRYNYGFGVDSNDNLFDEVRVIEANNVDSFSNGGYQTSKTLFKEGSSFDIGTYSKFFINKSSDKTKGLLDTGDSFSKTISIGEIK